MLDASGRLEIDIPRPNFNSRSSVAGIAGHQQALAIIANRTEFLPGSGVQPPDLLEAPQDLVTEGQAAPALIEPEGAADPKPFGSLGSHPAHPFLEPQGRRGLPPEDRQIAPPFGKSGLGNIDRRGTGNLDESQARIRAKGNQLVGRRRLGLGRITNFLRIIQPKSVHQNRPFARTHLDFHAPGIVDRHGDAAVNGGKLPALRQDGTDLLLAIPPRNNQFDLCA